MKGLIGMVLSLALASAAFAGESFRQLEIPAEEHGYSNFESVLIRSKADYDQFLKSVETQGAWNKRDAFVAGLKKAAVDFDKEALILIRHTEGSGSTRVTLQKPTLKDGTLEVKIATVRPEVGTADMAYYTFALAVDKAAVKVVEVLVDNNKKATLNVGEKKQ